jgi:hypothetical protein
MLFDKDPRTLSIMNNSKEHPKEKNREWNQINHFISNPHNSPNTITSTMLLIWDYKRILKVDEHTM